MTYNAKLVSIFDALNEAACEMKQNGLTAPAEFLSATEGLMRGYFRAGEDGQPTHILHQPARAEAHAGG